MLPEDSLLVKVLQDVKKTDPINSKALLQQAYENTFGIYDYVNQALVEQGLTDPALKKPLASVALHAAEDCCQSSKLYELLRLYSGLKVHDHYRLSLIEFLDLPHDVVDFILKDCVEKQKLEASKTHQVLEELKEGMKT